MSIFITILMISLFCLGLREVTDDIGGGRIGYPLRRWFVDNTPIWIMKPVIVCCTCMASFWGTIIYWLISIHYHSDELFELICSWETYGLWVFSCLSASFINTILWALRNKLISL